MNEIEEQRVIEALRAITGGLAVTEQDIVDAGNRMQHNLKAPKPPRRTPFVLAVAAVVALIAGLGLYAVIKGNDSGEDLAPANQPTPAQALRDRLDATAYQLSFEAFTQGKPATAADMTGAFLLRPDGPEAREGGILVRVEADGDWSYGFPGLNAGSSFAPGTWTQRFTEDGECAPDTGAPPLVHGWTTAVAGDGSVHLKLTAGPNVCTVGENYEVWDRLAPGSPVQDYLEAEVDAIAWAPHTGSQLSGIYYAPATGQLLEVFDGEFLFYTSADLSAEDDGQLSVVSDALTGSCTGGEFSAQVESGMIPAVPGLLAGVQAVRLTPTGGSCASGVSDQAVWLRLES